MANENCLKGMRCSKCHSNGPFHIEAKTIVKVYDDGTDDTQDFEWGDDSWIQCGECEHTATVKDFRIPELEIQRVLVLSTAHLRKETNDAMETDTDGPVALVSFDSLTHGYLVYCTDDPGILEDPNFPDEIRQAIQFAQEHDCTHLRYDPDAATLDQLPTWEW